MKVLGFDEKSKTAKIKVDSLDDLWHLSKLIEAGDRILGKSSRKIKLSEEEERQKSVKRGVFVELEVQEVDLGAHLKIHGLVQNESEHIPLFSAHSLDIELGTTFDLKKPRWREYQKDRLKEAEEASAAPKALLCVLDDEQAHLAYLTAAGYQLQGKINLRLSRKMYKEKQVKPQADLDKLVAKIRELSYDIDVIIIGSPLFWKEILYNRLKEAEPELSKKAHLENTHSGDEKGIQALVQSGTLDKITKKSQASKEAQLVEKFLQELAKESKMAKYRLSSVAKITPSGAVDTLLVTDSKLAEKKEEFLKVVDEVESLGGQVHIINSKSDPGRKLNGLGGIGALLRYIS